MLRKIINELAGKACPKSWAKFKMWRVAWANRLHWDKRIADVVACADNARLKRVPNAGKIDGDFQVMHNGLRVVVGGYYGNGITRMLAANRGCHEPQEEVVFDAIMRSLPAGAIMVEAGAYWGFYSMWFLQRVPHSKVFLIEPAAENLAIGQRNFLKNGCSGDFTRAYIGAQPGRSADGVRIVSIQSFLAEKGLERLDILHTDIQGSELEMLMGSCSLFESHAVDYVFISTHAAELHAQCSKFFRDHGYRLLVSVDLEETYSVDGFLAVCSPLVTPPNFAQPAKRPKNSGMLSR